jgi:toxin ParE1/3/4
MQIRWSPEAADDLERIVEFILRDNPSAARRIAVTINEKANALGRSPYIGRLGRVDSTRELALPPLPYLIVYRVAEAAGVVEIVNVVHGARRWP